MATTWLMRVPSGSENAESDHQPVASRYGSPTRYSSGAFWNVSAQRDDDDGNTASAVAHGVKNATAHRRRARKDGKAESQCDRDFRDARGKCDEQLPNGQGANSFRDGDHTQESCRELPTGQVRRSQNDSVIHNPTETPLLHFEACAIGVNSITSLRT